ncbi:MAG: ferritin family protein [Candidatus Sedimenticola sp. 20ELBAFRAG]
MNSTTSSALIDTVEEFLAHAMELELESVERYEQLADSMEVHNNLETASLFRKLAHFGQKHAHEVEQLASGMTLPKLPPWEFKWSTPESPESVPMEEAHYLMDAYLALQLALHNEQRGRDFYAKVADSSPNPEVREMALSFSEEEQEHIELIKKWKENLRDPSNQPQEDLDPPNMPE